MEILNSLYDLDRFDDTPFCNNAHKFDYMFKEFPDYIVRNKYDTKYQEYLRSFIYPRITLNDKNKNSIKYNDVRINSNGNNVSNSCNSILSNRDQVSSEKDKKRLRKKRKGSKEKNKRDRKKEGGVKLTPFQADTVSENKSIA